jgi:Glutathione S-transferase, N-terminal domain
MEPSARAPQKFGLSMRLGGANCAKRRVPRAFLALAFGHCRESRAARRIGYAAAVGSTRTIGLKADRVSAGRPIRECVTRSYMMIKLYDNAFSPFARKVRMVLEFKGLDFEVVDGLRKTSHEALKAVNRRVEVPARTHSAHETTSRS